jgi:hypothetical protein
MKLLLGIGLLCLPIVTRGADGSAAPMGPTNPPPSFKVTILGGAGGDADLAGGGHVGRWESAVDVEIPVSPTPRTGGRFSAGWGLTELDVRDRPGETVDPLHAFSLGYFGVAPLRGRWSAFYRGGALMAFESGAEWEEALLYQGMAGVDCRVTPELNLQIGGLGTTLLEEDPRLLPIIGFRWRPARGWLVATEGLGVQAQGPIRPDLQFLVRARWGSRAWRMDEDSDANPGGVLVYESIRCDTGVRWTLNPRIEIEARLGWETAASYRRLDERGSDQGRRDADDVPVGNLALTCRY